MRLKASDSLLVLIDMQERLMPVIADSGTVIDNAIRAIRGCRVLDVPVILTEQYVKGLGPTVEPVRAAIQEGGGSYLPIEKMCFPATGSGEFQAALREQKRKQVLIAGVETHVCVYQTAIELLASGHEVFLIGDAVSSRSPANREVAVRRMLQEGVRLTSTEMALFEMLEVSGTDAFRAISKIVK